MGNRTSTDDHSDAANTPRSAGTVDSKRLYRSFPGSAILEKTFCGRIDTTDPAEYEGMSLSGRLIRRAEDLCISSPLSDDNGDDHSLMRDFDSPGSESGRQTSSKILARALVNEVTNNPKTATAAELADRERRLLKAQEAAREQHRKLADSLSPRRLPQPVGTATTGVGPPAVLSSLAYACTGDDAAAGMCVAPGEPEDPDVIDVRRARNPHAVAIGISLSRRSEIGHRATVTRQTAFDFNELQDRQYKYVSSTDHKGWRAGGGEAGGIMSSQEDGQHAKAPSPDNAHIPIIYIDCPSAEAVDAVIHALASGEIFIPHMAIQPETLAVSGISPPDLTVRFGCERNDDEPPDEWPNWCLEFMHNQLYEYFHHAGARWMKRPHAVCIASGVRWKTVKHMNRYFAHAEKVLEQWKERGPQVLNPVEAHFEGGATPEEVARPHGIYLFRQGQPTNYFAPNFDPPYTTKMTRSLLNNVMDKSWDKKRREWCSEPMPRLVAPASLMAAACGCADSSSGGFMAREVTNPAPPAAAAASEYKTFAELSHGSVVAGSEVEFDDEEEKKVEERTPVAPPVKARRSPASGDDEKLSFATSAFNHSVAASGTTVMHSNTAVQLQGRLYSDEDFLSEVAATPLHVDPPGSKVEPKWTKKKNGGKKNLEDAQAKMDKERYTMASSTPNKPREPHVEQIHSGHSLDYSTDGSSAYFREGGDQSTLMGQQYASDGASTQAPAGVSPTKQQQQIGTREPDNEDARSGLSIQTSTSSAQSVVPTDEELFAVGWAKALDPASGSYYYFTLDRTKTVWENPLAPASSEVGSSAVDAPGA